MVHQKHENVNHFPEVKDSQSHIHLLQRKNTLFIFIACACQSLSHVQLFLIPRLQLTRLLCPWDSLGKNTRVDCHFPYRLNPGLLHCRQILYHLSYKEAPVYFHYTLGKNDCIYINESLLVLTPPSHSPQNPTSSFSHLMG